VARERTHKERVKYKNFEQRCHVESGERIAKGAGKLNIREGNHWNQLHL